MKRTLGLIVLFSSILFTSNLYAADSSSGCGLGWQVFKKNSLVSSFSRALVNFTFLNTVGMTLGTSGCTQHSIVKNEMKAIHYTEANLPELMTDVARGNGEYINALTEIMVPSNTECFSTQLRANYENVFFNQAGSSDVYTNIKSYAIGCAMI